MRLRGQILFWAAVIVLPISLLTGDGESFMAALGILVISFLIYWVLNQFK